MSNQIILGITVVFGILACLFIAWLTRKASVSYSPNKSIGQQSQRLFRELCERYHLDAREMHLLKDLATKQALSDPCKLFVEARHWCGIDAPKAQAENSPAQDALVALFHKLFVTSTTAEAT